MIGYGTYTNSVVVVDLQLCNVRRIDAVILQFVDVHMEAEALLVFLAAGHRCRHVAGESSRKVKGLDERLVLVQAACS